MQKDLLNSGGDLLIIPFNPGENVAASDQFDRISLKIVKGMSDILNQEDSRFKLLHADNARTAEMTVEGHILDLITPSNFQKWSFQDKRRTIKVEGRIIDIESRKVVLYFSHSRESQLQDQTFEDLALLIGEDIGRFILDGGN